MEQKIFCIGFHKTGTSSLTIALKTLGFDVCGRLDMLQEKLPKVDLINELKTNQYDRIFTVVDHFDAFSDNPWQLLYPEIVNRYPNSKFILSIRDEISWLKSMLNYFKNSSSEICSIIYGKGSPIGNEKLYLEKYRRHNKEVKAFFKNKSNDLLILDIDDENKWEELCHFLGKQVPSQDFPFENKGNLERDTSLTKFAKNKITLSRILRLISLPFRTQVLFIETLFLISIARMLVVCFPFQFIAKLLGIQSLESPEMIPVSQQLLGNNIGRMIRRVSLYTPFRSMCFEQALTCKFMLNLRDISSTIYFGLASETSDSINLKAHAWVRSGNQTLTGNKGKEKFQIVSIFGSKVNP